MKKLGFFLFFVMLLSACSIEPESQCTKLETFVCGERYNAIKQLKDYLSNPILVVAIVETEMSLGGTRTSLIEEFKNISDDCEKAKKLAQISRDGDTPFKRNVAELTCRDYNISFQNLMQHVSDK